MATEYERWPRCLFCGTSHQPYRWDLVRVLHPDGRHGWRAEFNTAPCQSVLERKTVTEFHLCELKRGDQLRARIMANNGLKTDAQWDYFIASLHVRSRRAPVPQAQGRSS